MLNNIIGKNIKLYRSKRKLTRREAASLAGFTSAYWGYLERGQKKPSLDVIEKIAVVLDIKPYLLFVDLFDDFPGELVQSLNTIKQMGHHHVQFIKTVIYAYEKVQGRRN